MPNLKNVIIISCDELRADAVGFMGNPDVRTPNLDRFAKRGLVLKNHFAVHGKCVPSRISLITGRHPHTDGFRTITQHLPDDRPNLITHLRRMGYETAFFGHPHITEGFWGDNTPGSGTTHWNSYTKGVFAELLKREWPAPPPALEARPPATLRDGRQAGYSTRREEPLTGFCDDNRAEQAIEFLTRTRDKSKPFFLQLNFGAPHPAYRAAEPWHSMYRPDRIRPWPHDLPTNAPLPHRAMREIRTPSDATPAYFRDIQATYYGMISKADALIGRVLETLDSQDAWNNSIVLFWSDHGDFAGQYGLYEKWDTAMNDCILKTPQIFCAPGLKPGAIDSLTSTTDLAPTIIDLLGAPPLPGVHGESLLPVFEGRRRKETVFAGGGHEPDMCRRFAASGGAGVADPANGKQETYRRYPDAMARTKMARSETHKLVVRLAGGNELYDLRDDPHELNNRWDDPALASVKQDLQLRLIEWCLRTDTDQPPQAEFGA